MLNINYYDIASLILSVTFVSTFIAIFFFTYAAKIEKQIVVKQVNYIVEDLFGTLNELLPDTYKPLLKKIIDNFEAPILTDADKIVDDSNHALMKNALKVLIIVFIIGVGVSYVISNMFNLDFKELVIKNLIILFGIAIVEFSFATFIATQYISGDPNYVRSTVLNHLKNIEN